MSKVKEMLIEAVQQELNRAIEDSGITLTETGEAFSDGEIFAYGQCLELIKGILP